MDVLKRNNVAVSGNLEGPAIVFAHGFGCDQHMWRLVAPAFEHRYKVVLFDHVGSGSSDLSAYAPAKYETLAGYASDVVEICEALDLNDVIFVGHSVSSMIGTLAANAAPALFKSLVMVAPSPRYVNDGDYVGGFSPTDIDGLLSSLDANYLGWSQTMAPMIMANNERPELGSELTNSFCRTDPQIAKQFARATFLADNRLDIEKLSIPVLVMQCSDDLIAPRAVGEYIANAIDDSTLVVLDATGHCPNLSAPQETIIEIDKYLDTLAIA